MYIVYKFISENEDCNDAHNVCDECDRNFLITIMKAMSWFANILNLSVKILLMLDYLEKQTSCTD